MTGARPYQQCTRCLMDTSDPEIGFDAAGMCSHCMSYDEARAALPTGAAAEAALGRMVDTIRKWGRGKEYDCLLGVSGGVDSTYTAWFAKQLGLRPLALHFDSGWNSELAVGNIEQLCRRLGVDLYTYVVDWEEMRDLQRSFLRAGVANCDIPTDHGFVAVLYRQAARRGFKYIVSGHNISTEWILPKAWGYGSRDVRHIKAIQARFGTRPLRRFPLFPLWYDVLWCRLVKRIAVVTPLNLIPYVKADAMATIEREVGWRPYGAKHFESVFTRWFQGFYLPQRFGYDKRRSHLSSLVVSGQMTRAEATAEIQGDPYPAVAMEADRVYVMKKLGIDEAEFAAIMSGPRRTQRDFPSNERLINALFAVRGALRSLRDA